MTQAIITPNIPETDSESPRSNRDRARIVRHVAQGLSDDPRPIVVIDIDDVAVEALLQAGIAPERIHLKVTDPTTARRMYPRWERHGIRIDAGPLDQIPQTLQTRYGDDIRLALLWLASGGTFETIAPRIPPYVPLIAPIGKRRTHIVVTVADQRGNRALNNAENTKKLGQRLLGADTFDRIQTALRERHGRPYPWITDGTSLTDQAYKEFSLMLHLLAVLAGSDIAQEALAELDQIFKPDATVGPNSTMTLRNAELRVGMQIAERLTYLGCNDFRMAAYRLNVIGRGGHAVPLPDALEAACEALANARCGAVQDGEIHLLKEGASDAKTPSMPPPSLPSHGAATAEEPNGAVPTQPNPVDTAQAPSTETAPLTGKHSTILGEPENPTAAMAASNDETPISPPAATGFEPTPACPTAATPPPTPAADFAEIETFRARLAPAFQALAGFMPDGPAMLERLLALALVGVGAEATIASLQWRIDAGTSALALAKRVHAAALELRERELKAARTELDSTRQETTSLKRELAKVREMLRHSSERLSAIRAAVDQASLAEPTEVLEDEAPIPTPALRPDEQPPTETKAHAATTPQPPDPNPPAAAVSATMPEATPPVDAKTGKPSAERAKNKIPSGNAALHAEAKAALPAILTALGQMAPSPKERPDFSSADANAVDLAVLAALCCHVDLGWLGAERSRDRKEERAERIGKIRDAYLKKASPLGFSRAIGMRQASPNARSAFRKRMLRRFPELGKELNALFRWALRSDKEIAASLGPR